MRNDRSKGFIYSVERITDLCRVIINDEEYVWDCDFKGGKVFIEMSGRHRAVPFTDEEIARLLDSGDMVVDPGYHTAKAAERRGVSRVELMNMLEKKKLAKAMYRLTWVELYLQHKAAPKSRRPDGGIVPLMQLIRDGYLARNKESERANKRKVGYLKEERFSLAMPSAGSIRTWVERYRTADFDVSGLIDRHKGDRTSKFTDEERSLHARFALKYASTTKPSIAHLHRRMVATFNRINRARGLTGNDKLRPISETWLAEKIDQLPDFFKMAGREGSRKARMHFQAVRKGMDKGVPFQRLEADEWTVDLHTLLVESCVWAELTPEERRLFAAVRLTFSGAICVTTKCIAAMRVFEGSGSIETAYATIEMTARDKTDLARSAGCRYPWEMRGRFGSIGLDSATWFVSDAIKASLLDSGCSAIYPPSGEPYLRGTIERFFRTIAYLGLQEFSGRTFSNIIEKGDNAPEAEASIRKDLLVLIFIRLIVDVYHNMPHAGLGGLTPRRAWLEMTRERSPVPPPTGFMLRNIYGIPATRKITKAGICFEDIQYQSPEIQAMRRDDQDQWVDIKVDRHDLGEISVVCGDVMLRVKAVMKGLKGVSLWKWMAAKERLRVSDRQHLEFTQAAVDDAIEWAAEQADIALAEMELGTPVITSETVDMLEAKADRYIKIVDVSAEHRTAIANQIALHPELKRIFGITSTLKPIAETKPVPSLGVKITASIEVPRKGKTRGRKAKTETEVLQAPSSPEPFDDEFGLPD